MFNLFPLGHSLVVQSGCIQVWQFLLNSVKSRSPNITWFLFQKLSSYFLFVTSAHQDLFLVDQNPEYLLVRGLGQVDQHAASQLYQLSIRS